MNDDLIIDIGADLSSFNSAMKTAENAFKNLQKVTSSKPIKLTVEGMVKQLQKEKAAYAKFAKQVKAIDKSITKAQTQEMYERKKVNDKAMTRRIANAHKTARAIKNAEKKTTAVIKTEHAKREKLPPYGNVERFGHAVRTTALYGGVAQILFGIQSAFGAVITETARFDNSIKKTAAVLGKSRIEGKKLADTIVQVGKDYGQTFEEIEEGMLTIGRAGIDNTQQLQAATEGLAALSIITGDGMKYGAEAVASLISVYPELTKGSKEYVYAQGEIISGTEDLINKMGAVANATRLGLEDFSTISNYALTTASAIGLTSDAYLTLAGSLSKVGLNASTIGTSIRRLNKFTDDTSDAVQTFFNVVGKSQSQFKKDVMENEEELGYFAQRLADMSPKEFTQATKDLNIQLKATATSFRKIGQNNQFAKMMAEVKEAKSILAQAGLAAEGLSTRWNRAVNTLKSSMNVATSAIIVELEKVFTSASKDGPNAFDTLAEAVESFGIFTIRIIAQITTAVSGFVNLLRVAIGGLAKLAGYANEMGAKLYTHSKADIIAQERSIELQREKLELAKKNGKNITIELQRLRKLEKKLKEMGDDNAYADSLRLRADAQEKWGEEVIENAAKSQEFVNNLLEAVDKGTLSYEKAKEKMAEAAKDLPRYDAGIGGYDAKGLPITETPNQKKANAEILRYKKLISGELTYQQAKLEELNLKIDAQTIKAKELAVIAEKRGATEKQKTDALKAYSQQLALEYDKKLMLQRLEESGGGKLAKEREKLSVFELKVGKEKIKQALVLAKIAGVGKGGRLKLELDMLKDQEELMKKQVVEATKKAKGQRTQLALQKAITDYYNAQLDVQEKQLEIANQYADAFDKLFDGDITGAFESMMTTMGDNFKTAIIPIGDAWSQLWSGMMSTAGATSKQITAMLQSTGWYLLIQAGITLLQNFSTSTISEAEMRAAEGITGVQSESIVNSLDNIEKYDMLGLDYAQDMMYSLRALVNYSNTAAANIGTSLSGDDYITRTDTKLFGLFGTSTTELVSKGIKIQSASIQELIDGQLEVTKYQIEKVTSTGLFGTGLFGGESLKTTDLGSAGSDVIEPITSAYLEGVNLMREATEAFGMSAVDFDAIMASWETSISQLNFEGKDSTEIADMINGVISSDLDNWAMTLGSVSMYIEEFKKAGEGASETLIRLVADYEALSATFDLMGFNMNGITDGGLRMAEALADAAGGMDQFLDKLNFFIDNFYTDSERMAFQTEILRRTFVGLNITMPTTIGGMKALVNARLDEIATLTQLIELEKAKVNIDIAYIDTLTARLTALSEETDMILGTLPMWTEVFGDAQSSCEDATSALTEFNDMLMTIAGIQAEWTEDPVEAAQIMLDAVTAQTGLTGINYDNFLEEFNNAVAGADLDKALADLTSATNSCTNATNSCALANDSCTDSTDALATLFDGASLEDWGDLSSALQGLEDAINEVLQVELDALTAELDFYENILSTIQDAYVGSLSYLTTAQKADYLESQAGNYLASGDTQSYLDTLAQQLEYEKATTTTKEEYVPYFENYIKELQDAEYEPEATTDDVVAQIIITNEKLDDMADAIEKASLQ